MLKRNEEKFQKMQEKFEEALKNMEAMDDEELYDYIDDQADTTLYMGTGIHAIVDDITFLIPIDLEELKNYFGIDENTKRCKEFGLKYVLNEKYLIEKCEVLEYFLSKKRDIVFASMRNYIEKKLTDNGINEKYNTLIEKLNSLEDENFADYIFKESSLIENRLSGGLHGFIDDMEFEIEFDNNDLPELTQDERIKYFLIEKREDVIKSLENSREEELKMYLESERF